MRAKLAPLHSPPAPPGEMPGGRNDRPGRGGKPNTSGTVNRLNAISGPRVFAYANPLAAAISPDGAGGESLTGHARLAQEPIRQQFLKTSSEANRIAPSVRFADISPTGGEGT